jgi:hypothetical protein
MLEIWMLSAAKATPKDILHIYDRPLIEHIVKTHLRNIKIFSNDSYLQYILPFKRMFVVDRQALRGRACAILREDVELDYGNGLSVVWSLR